MLQGATNRRIAARLEIGVRTVERVRSRILKKIGVESLFEVARLYGLALDYTEHSEVARVSRTRQNFILER